MTDGVDLFAGPTTAAKDCTRCAETKPLAEFHVDRKRPDGRVQWCKTCRKEYRALVYARDPEAAKAYQADWKRRNPEKISEYGRRYRHGLEPGQYAAMVEAQNGCCAVCGRGDEVLRVDHDHATGAIRGLLCDRCNRALGFFADDAATLVSAAAYLWAAGGGDAL